MSLIRPLDHLLNKVTMYRLLVYVLAAYLAIGLLFSFTGVLSLSGWGLLLSIALLIPICYVTNRLIASLYPAARNTESWLITALILACILPPATTKLRILGVIIAAIVAMAAKYILAIKRHHVFNPAATGAVVVALVGLTFAVWWVGSPAMLPFTLVGGLLIARKIRHINMVLVFIIAALAVAVLIGLQHHQLLTTILHNVFMSSPLIFLGTIMLTEPTTMPTSDQNQLLFGALVGALFASQLHVGSIGSTPENVLVIGNLFAYLSQPRHKVRLKLVTKNQLSPQIYDFVFKPDTPLSFKAGQYLEWTLPHTKVDRRGNRRSFTIAASPTESELHLGVKFYEPSSSFKRALRGLQPGQNLIADQLAGNFCLPHDPTQKLVFVAGGIGITPFRSMLKYLIDTDQKRDITLIYLVNSADEIVYRDIINQAIKSLGLSVVLVVTKGELPPGTRGYTGRLTTEEIQTEIPDYTERHFYLSGPNALVENYTDLLHRIGVPSRHIVTDYFSGY